MLQDDVARRYGKVMLQDDVARRYGKVTLQDDVARRYGKAMLQDDVETRLWRRYTGKRQTCPEHADDFGQADDRGVLGVKMRTWAGSWVNWVNR
jgi:hypothetical protein